MESVIKIRYNPTRGSLTFTGGDIDHTMLLGDLTQIVFLTRNPDFINMIKNGKEEIEIKISSYDNSAVAFLAAHGMLKYTEKRGKSQVPKDMRDELWKLYHGENKEGVCYTCGNNIQHGNTWHAAHVVATSKGGSTNIDNLRTCCRKCNLSMRNQNLYAFISRKKLTGPGSANTEVYFDKNPQYKGDKITRRNRDLMDVICQSMIIDKPVDTLSQPGSMYPCQNEHKERYNFECKIQVVLEDSESRYIRYDVKSLPDGGIIIIKNNNMKIWPAKSDIVEINISEYHFKILELIDNDLLLIMKEEILLVYNFRTQSTVLPNEDIKKKIKLIFNKNGDNPHGYIITNTYQGTKIWDENLTFLHELKGHKNLVHMYAFLLSDKIVTGSADTTLRIWNLKTGECEAILTGNNNIVTHVYTLPDGRIVSGSFNEVRIWSSTGKQLISLSKGEIYNHLIITKHGGIVTTDHRKTYIWDLETGELKFTLQGKCYFPLLENYVLTKSYGVVYVYDLLSGEVISKYGCITEYVESLFKLPNNKIFLIISKENDNIKLGVWDGKSEELERYCPYDKDVTDRITVLEDGRISIPSVDTVDIIC
jgi:WD40 repeat protein/5-methylcytosine-specific restriction endonuclease McrA